MDIVEELKAAHMRYLQDEWDKRLIAEWRTGIAITGHVISSFIKKHNVNYETFDQLRRIPRFRTQIRTRLTRFIAAYLPDLNTLLWADRYSDEQILKAMKRFDTLKKPADEHKAAAEKKERTKASKEAMAQRSSHLLVKEQREFTSKSNWKQCK